MKFWILMIPVILTGVVVSVFWGRGGGADAPSAGESELAPVVGRRAPVIVELFTSEGCSSCPPADRVLKELDEVQPVTGTEIIAMSEHVDYWNYIGWSDPFSSDLYSARQQAYATAFGHESVYTPQMIVDGRVEFNGSNMSRAREAIAQAARLPKADIRLSRNRTTPDQAARLVVLKIDIDRVPPVDDRDFAEVLIAVTENRLSSNVTRGENTGRNLSHNAVAREIRSLGRIDSATRTFSAETRVLMAGEWKAADLRVLVFVQERARRRILGAAAMTLTE